MFSTSLSNNDPSTKKAATIARAQKLVAAFAPIRATLEGHDDLQAYIQDTPSIQANLREFFSLNADAIKEMAGLQSAVNAFIVSQLPGNKSSAAFEEQARNLTDTLSQLQWLETFYTANKWCVSELKKLHIIQNTFLSDDEEDQEAVTTNNKAPHQDLFLESIADDIVDHETLQKMIRAYFTQAKKLASISSDDEQVAPRQNLLIESAPHSVISVTLQAEIRAALAKVKEIQTNNPHDQAARDRAITNLTALAAHSTPDEMAKISSELAEDALKLSTKPRWKKAVAALSIVSGLLLIAAGIALPFVSGGSLTILAPICINLGVKALVAAGLGTVFVGSATLGLGLFHSQTPNKYEAEDLQAISKRVKPAFA